MLSSYLQQNLDPDDRIEMSCKYRIETKKNRHMKVKAPKAFVHTQVS